MLEINYKNANYYKNNSTTFKENDQFFKFTRHVSTELQSSSVEWFHGKASWIISRQKNAN